MLIMTSVNFPPRSDILIKKNLLFFSVMFLVYKVYIFLICLESLAMVIFYSHYFYIILFD